ncbi:MAG: hypothetical protein HYX48_06010 [Chlamydiales bacterium]|nr:hypothetical protein [Chlamydiales bacterium]
MASRTDYAQRTPQDAYVAICEWADSDGLVALSRVSKAFNAATREVIRYLSDELKQVRGTLIFEEAYAKNDYPKDRPIEEALTTYVKACDALLTKAIGRQPPGNLPAGEEWVVRLRQQVRFIHVFGVVQPSRSENLRLLFFFSRFFKDLNDLQLPEQNAWVHQENWLQAKLIASGEADSHPLLTAEERSAREAEISVDRTFILMLQSGRLKTACNTFETFYYIPELVTRRFHKTMQEGSTDLTPFMRDLKADAEKSSAGAARFRAFCADSQRLSTTKINQLEEFLLNDPLHRARDSNFRQLCIALHSKGIFTEQDVSVVIDLLRTAFARPDIAVRIAQVEELSLSQITDIPPELSALTGLKKLSIFFKDGTRLDRLDLRAFAFTQLTHLHISKAGLNEVPLISESATSLSKVTISQQEPIYVLTDDLARRTQANSLLAYFYQAVVHSAFWDPNNQIGFAPLRYMGLDSSHLSDLPFFIWFRDNCNVPHIPILDLGMWARNASYPFIGDVSTMLENLFTGRFYSLMNNPALIPWALLLAVPAALLGITFIALNVAIFGVNLFLNYAIEPIVTYFRDQLGYSRMVHIRNFPEQGAAL